MSHLPISLHNVGLAFPHKVCFQKLTTQIYAGNKIAIIGRNGSGKSTLLKILQGIVHPTQGDIKIPDGITFGYVPQIIENENSLSGGQKFNHALSQSLANSPNILILDEPTNCLDLHNRKSLMRMLSRFSGTLIFVSHDLELLKIISTTIWHIDDGKVNIFSGSYDAYKNEYDSHHKATLAKIAQLKKESKKTKKQIELEHSRAAQSRKANRYENDRNLRGAMKESGSRTTGKKKGNLNVAHDQLAQELHQVKTPEVIKPTFSFAVDDIHTQNIVTISDGACGYGDEVILKNISMTMNSHERVWLSGKNGSGKSTFIKALLGDEHVVRFGEWHAPKPTHIGYLDQHYATLHQTATVFDTIADSAPSWNYAQIRNHLNDFLFRKNEEVETRVENLSGGEKARLSLALIAAKTPNLLILDEITNNLDLETNEHIIKVLRDYRGALLVISHDRPFLQAINISTMYEIIDGQMVVKNDFL